MPVLETRQSSGGTRAYEDGKLTMLVVVFIEVSLSWLMMLMRSSSPWNNELAFQDDQQ